MSIQEKAENELVGTDNQGEDYSRKRKRKREAVVETAVAEPQERKKKRKERKDASTEKKAKRRKDAANLQEESAASQLIEEGEVDTSKKGQVTSDLHPELDSKMKKKKKNKDRKNTALEGSQEDANPELNNAVVSEKSKGKRTQKPTENSDADDAEPTSKLKQKRKHKKTAVEDVLTESAVAPATVQEGEGKPRRTKKRKHEKTSDAHLGAATEPEVAQEDEGKPHKTKKRKHEKISDANLDASEHAEPSTSRKKKKRASHKNSEFADPSEDAILSESARKALSYVHSRVSPQPGWKFNKARQNWVLRNVWDDNAVPEKYFPSCMKYLAGVQGNTRQLLVKASTELIESSEPKAKVTTSDATAEDVKSEPNAAESESPEERERRRILKNARARTMLATLEAGAEDAS